MNSPRIVSVLVGSLRRESLTRKVANALIGLAPPSLALAIVEIRSLPFYNQDDEGDPPVPWVAFRASIRSSDAVIFTTPEYNRSVPAVLKNAIDVGSRPFGQGVWTGKPAGIVSVSPGSLGAFGANHHLRQSLVFVDMPAMAQPEAYIGHAADLFDAENRLVKDSTRAFLTKYLEAFAAWVDRVGKNG